MANKNFFKIQEKRKFYLEYQISDKHINSKNI